MRNRLSRAERETAEFYDQVPFRSVLKTGQKRHRFFENLPVRGYVLDVGTGSGRTSRLLRDLFPRAEFACLDISLQSLRRLDVGARINASALELPFRDAAFDFVVSVGCLHHTPDARAGFSECVRVLKPGCGIVIAVYNKWNSYPMAYRFGRHSPRFLRRMLHHPLIHDQFFTPHASFHSPAEVREWFREEGVSFVRYESTGYMPPYGLRSLGQFVYYFGLKRT